MKQEKMLKLWAANSHWLPIILKDRNYHLPKEFGKWQSIASEIAMCMDVHDLGKSRLDLASQLTTNRTFLWFLTDSPVYCINSQLLRDLLETDVNKLSAIAGLVETVPLHTFMVVFPSWFKTPDGLPIKYAILHWGDKSKPSQSMASGYGMSLPYWPQEYQVNIHLCFSCNCGEIVWFSGTGLEDGQLKVNPDYALGNATITESEKDFVEQLRSLTIQIFLLLAYKPELLDNPSETSSQGFGKTSQKTSQQKILEQKRYPRILGKSHYNPSLKSSQSTGIKQRCHVRKGHWRDVPCGPGKQQRKPTWILPYWVGI
ncbi:hypothetical protein [Laspinema olomoucense]|uniref:hypothetical protein n=1 Tax=Laspinema olomoucense TaxID=3231600 RepID=UPI0021BA6308|nr:hypothetical protein [Laspinema sp. D3d]MCT7971242.1 hypothetical protein [Laspinema sp. D3d]